MNDTKKPNYKAFIPAGITFLGTGAVFIAAVNPAIGLRLSRCRDRLYCNWNKK